MAQARFTIMSRSYAILHVEIFDPPTVARGRFGHGLNRTPQGYGPGALRGALLGAYPAEDMHSPGGKMTQAAE